MLVNLNYVMDDLSQNKNISTPSLADWFCVFLLIDID